MISDNQAKNLKTFLWQEISHDTLNKCPPELINELNKIIDKASMVKNTAADREVLYLKNLIAYILLMSEKQFIDNEPSYIIENLKRYCLSNKFDEYKYTGLGPPFYIKLYEYFDKHLIPLDTEEEKAKALAEQFKQLDVKMYIDRRWVQTE